MIQLVALSLVWQNHTHQQSDNKIMTSCGQATYGEIDAVLPLRLRDWERFRILDVTLKKFFVDLRICWVVVCKEEQAELASRIDGRQYRVISENDLVPEFCMVEGASGWFKQQLIKLAISDRITTEFYITFDADVVCTKVLQYSDLIVNGRGGCFVQSIDIHAEWYDWAERALGLKRSGVSHAVTPTVYAREAVIKLQKYLSSRVSTKILTNDRGWPRLLKPIKQKSVDHEYPRPWALFLLRNLPWTEQSLYYTFLEATGQFEQYHFRAVHCLYSAHSLWNKAQIEFWNPCLGPDDPSFFIVVQSNTGIDPQLVREKLGSLFDTVS